mgnify:FL=1
MLCLYLSDHLESYSDSGETFFLCDLSELRIQFSPLLILTSCRGGQVLSGCSDYACRIRSGNLNHSTFQEFKETFSVFLLLLGCFHENTCDLLVTFFFSYASEKCVTTSCLRFSGE